MGFSRCCHLLNITSTVVCWFLQFMSITCMGFSHCCHLFVVFFAAAFLLCFRSAIYDCSSSPVYHVYSPRSTLGQTAGILLVYTSSLLQFLCILYAIFIYLFFIYLFIFFFFIPSWCILCPFDESSAQARGLLAYIRGEVRSRLQTLCNMLIIFN